MWPQIEHEADDGLASAAAVAAGDPRVERVLICTPDKDLAQCVSTDGRVVQYDRRQRVLYDHAGVVEKFGVPPASIPDYLGLVGDSADGFPGLPGWGAKSASALLARYGHIPAIPFDPAQWDVQVRGAAKLAAALRDGLEDALLFRRIATVELGAPVSATVDEMEWRGPRPGLEERCAALGRRAPRGPSPRTGTRPIGRPVRPAGPVAGLRPADGASPHCRPPGPVATPRPSRPRAPATGALGLSGG